MKIQKIIHLRKEKIKNREIQFDQFEDSDIISVNFIAEDGIVYGDYDLDVYWDVQDFLVKLGFDIVVMYCDCCHDRNICNFLSESRDKEFNEVVDIFMKYFGQKEEKIYVRRFM